MKRVLLIVLVAVMAISLFACTPKEEPVQAAPEAEASASVDLSKTEEQPVVEEENVYDGPVSPTTGMPTDDPVYHPVIVQIDNEATGRPQYAIQDADIVYETMIEGADTRLTALYNDTLPEKVGPVRSARVYHQKIAAEWDPIFCHQGGPFSKSYPDTYLYSEANGDVFKVRLNGTKMGNSDEMWAVSNSIEYCNPSAIIAKYDYPRTQRSVLFQFDAAFEDTSARQVAEVGIPFLSNYDHYTYVYDSATDKFKRFRYGEPFVDANNENEPISVQNIIVQYAKRREMSGEGGRILMDVVGEGKAEFFIGGRHYFGTWSKDDVKSPTIYRFDNGDEITLRPGNTWIEVQPNSHFVRTTYTDGTFYQEDASV